MIRNKVIIFSILLSTGLLSIYKFHFQSANKSGNINKQSAKNITCPAPSQQTFWKIQSIDTMKQSRDLARAKKNDKSFEREIDQQVSAISSTGATHITIDTPYDPEFIPFLKKWIASARKYNLKIWFKGNWSGWEGWFNYPKNLSRRQHQQKTIAFILQYPEFFEDGDIFSPCPECENGGPGDPRQNKNAVSHQQFIIKEFEACNKSFKKINKKVLVLFPMNNDVAKMIMDKKTTAALGGYVTTDHYSKSHQQLIEDLRQLAINSGGKIVLGEFGLPIPDIHGQISPKKQAEWIKALLKDLSIHKKIIGVNYWVNKGGSTAIWQNNNEAKPAVNILRKAFKPQVFYGRIVDEFNQSIKSAEIKSQNYSTGTNQQGCFFLLVWPQEKSLFTIKADNFNDKNITLNNQSKSYQKIVLSQKDVNKYYHIKLELYKKFGLNLQKHK